MATALQGFAIAELSRSRRWSATHSATHSRAKSFGPLREHELSRSAVPVKGAAETGALFELWVCADDRDIGLK
jgi:hypothetical protein